MANKQLYESASRLRKAAKRYAENETTIHQPIINTKSKLCLNYIQIFR
jgi:hypothetical protein